MSEEPWDELSMGPRNAAGAQDPGVIRSEPFTPPVRSSESSTPPPMAAFGAVPERWSRQNDPPTPEEAHEATQNAVAAMEERRNALNRSGEAVPFSFTSKNRRRPMDDDVAYDDYEDDSLTPPGSTNGRSQSYSHAPRSSSYSNVRASYDSDDDAPPVPVDESPKFIREEALKMLQVVDGHLTGSPYSVHRTTSGGFKATHKTLGAAAGQQQRVPTALSGLSFTNGSKRLANPVSSFYTRDHHNTDELPAPARATTCRYQDDYEYVDNDMLKAISSGRTGVVSPISDEEGTKSTRSWSSRYSIDNTLLALSNSSSNMSPTRYLDKMDRESSRDRRQLFTQKAKSMNTAAASDRRPSVSTIGSGGSKQSEILQQAQSLLQDWFGRGRAFVHRHLNKHQHVQVPVSPETTNLRTAWMDMESASMPSDSSRKSWQEEQDSKRKRRTAILFILIGVGIFMITMGSLFGRKKDKSASTAAAHVPEGSTTFFVTSNAPYTMGDSQKMEFDLKNLPANDGSSFLVHLGNIQQAEVSLCHHQHYQDASDILTSSSPIPTFVLPGTEDWPNCPDPDRAWDHWYDAFVTMDQQFEQSSLQVAHQNHRLENFAFERSGVLFVGIHVVGGKIYSDEDLERRNGDAFRWVQGMATDRASTVRALVVFGNARPGLPQNAELFRQLASFLSDYGKPSLYVHSHNGEGVDTSEEYKPFADLAPQVQEVQAPRGGLEAPLQISVAFGDEPFIIAA